MLLFVIGCIVGYVFSTACFYCYLEKQDDKEQQNNESDSVSLAVYEQVRWERDLAISQLNEYGVQLGEKAVMKRTD